MGPTKPPKKRKGHGRNGADAYTGAEIKPISHPELKAGAPCPSLCNGRVYPFAEPSKVIRLFGQGLAHAVRYELEKFRCNLCLEVFTAPLPEEAGPKKYTASFKSVLSVNHYILGMPFYRLGKFHKNIGIPLAPSNQFFCVESVAGVIFPIYRVLLSMAANAELKHIDDTRVQIASLVQENKTLDKNQRRGMFTTGVVAEAKGHKIQLVMSGRDHAGENLSKLLAKRDNTLFKVTVMSDALSRNCPKENDYLKLIKMCFCLIHGRRKFYECCDDFPEVCNRVLDDIGQVYKHEKHCKEHGYDKVDRMRYHRKHSKPVMKKLYRWLKKQIDKKLVEPNGSLGGAIKYMMKHWSRMTAFWRIPGAPIDNNACERLLKKAIVYRKNSQGYRTEYGAWVGDVIMSVCFTAEHAQVNPIDYLTALQENTRAVEKTPGDWLPWNYQHALDAPAALAA